MSQLVHQLYEDNIRQGQVLPAELVFYNRGHQHCPRGHYHLGVRNYFLIHIVLKGKGWFRLGDNKIELTRGEGFAMFPGLIGEYQAHGKEPWSYCWIGFQGAMAEYHLQDLGIDPSHPCFQIKEPDRLESLLTEETAGFRGYADNPMAGQGMIYRFLGLLSQDLYVKHPTEKARYVHDAIDFIRKNFSQPVTVTDIAQSVGIDRTYLFSLFKNQTGKSPKEYLTTFRLDAACELLRDHGLSVKATARSVGYEDELYFSRVFKQFIGVPPSKYAGKNQSKPNS